MRVAIVHDWLTGMRGGEKVLEVLCDLWPDADLYTLLHVPGSVSPAIERRRIHTSFLQNLPGAAVRYRHYLPFFPLASRALRPRDCDLVFSTSHCVAKAAVAPPGAVHLSYVHTPMRYVWDMYDDYFGPGRAGLPVRAAMRLLRPWLRWWDARTAPRVDHFIANSEHVRERIQRHYGRDATVIHPPVDAERFAIAKETGDYYLVVSAFAPYKRIDVAIAAFARLGRPLKIVGSGQDEARLKRMAPSNVEFLGWRDSAELRDLYAGCRAFVFPGEEDFGITPLEAQASGRPVIAYGKGGALETVRGARPSGGRPDKTCTGVFFDTQSEDALCEAVEYFEREAPVSAPEQVRAHALTFDRSVCRDRIAAFVRDKLA